MAGENNENEEDLFNEENLHNVLKSPDRESMDFSFFDNLPTPPPPPPNIELYENVQILQDAVLPDARDGSSLEEQLTLAMNMFGPLSDNFYDNNVQGEIGNGNNGDDNNVGETTRLEVSTRDFEENRMIVETGGSSPIPVLEENANADGDVNNVGENSRLEVSTRVFGENRMIIESGGPSTTPVPVTPTITDGIKLCICCGRLRSLVHTSGPDKMILNIYGGNGFFCYAVLETHLLTSESRYQTIGFKDLETEDVQQYIEEYCMARLASGFELVTDVNAPFYQGMNADSDLNQTIEPTTPPSGDDIPMSLEIPPVPRLDEVQPPGDDIPLSLEIPHVPRLDEVQPPGEDIPIPPVPPSDGVRDEVQPTNERPGRQTPLALQRARISNMTLEDLRDYFNLPLEEVARQLKVCPTVLKRICRKGNLDRWPHRQIKSLENRIFTFKSVLRTAKNPAIRETAEKEIKRLQDEIDAICNEILRNAK